MSGNAKTLPAQQRGNTLVNLREMLIRGEFPPNTRIFEVPLAERLGVSRTPIRLALERLAHEGLLEAGPGGGFTVREFTVRDIWDAIEMRGLLEGGAARLAAERLVDISELDPLFSLNSTIDALVKGHLLVRPSDEVGYEAFARFGQLNTQFHDALVELAKSPMLKWGIDRLQSIPFAPANAMIFPHAGEIMSTAIAQHHMLLDAIQHRESARAEAIAREHARLARRNLELALADKTELGRAAGAGLIIQSSKTATPNTDRYK